MSLPPDVPIVLELVGGHPCEWLGSHHHHTLLLGHHIGHEIGLLLLLLILLAVVVVVVAARIAEELLFVGRESGRFPGQIPLRCRPLLPIERRLALLRRHDRPPSPSVVASHPVVPGGLGLMAGARLVAGRAGVVVFDVPAVRPAIIHVFVAAERRVLIPAAAAAAAVVVLEGRLEAHGWRAHWHGVPCSLPSAAAVPAPVVAVVVASVVVAAESVVVLLLLRHGHGHGHGHVHRLLLLLVGYHARHERLVLLLGELQLAQLLCHRIHRCGVIGGVLEHLVVGLVLSAVLVVDVVRVRVKHLRVQAESKIAARAVLFHLDVCLPPKVLGVQELHVLLAHFSDVDISRTVKSPLTKTLYKHRRKIRRN